ncbi:MAG: SsrA-binding protein SmpB [Proteobacteria bacterium]|nr:SsrA-binding protein SmpB [Pseudomonadota bacterium]
MAKASSGGKAGAGRKVIVRNKKAFHEYLIFDRYEAGLMLVGSEVKSLRDGRVNLGDAYAEIRNSEVWLVNAHIGPYPQATHFNHEPLRPRKLLLHAAEIARLETKVQERGFTLVPLELYFSDGRAKVEVALAKGKQQHDKRHAARERDVARELAQSLGRRR